MQIMEGDLAPTIEKNLARIAHMQLADNPGRHEPGTGEINYGFLLLHRSCRLPGVGRLRVQAGNEHSGSAGLGWPSKDMTHMEQTTGHG